MVSQVLFVLLFLGMQLHVIAARYCNPLEIIQFVQAYQAGCEISTAQKIQPGSQMCRLCESTFSGLAKSGLNCWINGQNIQKMGTDVVKACKPKPVPRAPVEEPERTRATALTVNEATKGSTSTSSVNGLHPLFWIGLVGYFITAVRG